MPATAGAYKVFRNRKALYERKLKRAARGVLDRTVSQVLSRLKAGGSPVSSLPSAVSLGKEMVRALAPTAAAAHNAAALYALQSVEAAYGRPLPKIPAKKIYKADGAFILSKAVSTKDLQALGLVRTIQNVYEPEALTKIKTIGSDYIGALRDQIVQSQKLNEGMPALIGRIEQFGNGNGFRADRIAWTESTRLFNSSTLDAYSKSSVVKTKMWITNMSSGRSRPEHQDAHEQEVPVDEPFSVGGEDLMYPGDPAGSDWNVINCQCAMMPVIGAVEPAGTSSVTDEESNLIESGAVTSSRSLSNEESGANIAFKVKIDNKVDAIFKPARYAGDPSALSEKLAYDVSKDIGLSNVPATTVRKIKGKLGSCQVWVGSSKSVAELSMKDPDRLLKIVVLPKYTEQRARMRVFDAIINNTDRHAGNYLVNATGEVTFIDNEAAFRVFPALTPLQLQTYAQAVRDLTVADKKLFKDALQIFQEDNYAEKLVNLGLNQKTAKAFTQRAKFLLDKTNWER